MLHWGWSYTHTFILTCPRILDGAAWTGRGPTRSIDLRTHTSVGAFREADPPFLGNASHPG